MSKPIRLDRLRLDVLTYFSFGIFILIFIFPLLWAFSLSIRTAAEVFIRDLRIVPLRPTVQNYFEVLRNPSFIPFLANGVFYAVMGSVGALVCSAPAAYAFSRKRFRGRNVALLGVLSLQMVSPLVIMIPLYRYYNTLGLLNTRLGATLVYIAIAIPIFTWMLKGFIDTIPRSLEEAAIIDGCSAFGAFIRIIVPLSAPGITAAFTLTTIRGWAEFVVPFILLTSQRLMPISVGIYNFQTTFGQTTTQLVAAASILAIVPALVFFLFLQKFVIGSMIGGSIKG